MNSVNQTLYIPLYGKAFVSRKGIILEDAKAEQIWAAEGFPLKGKAKSKWLAYYMGMRSAVFDRWVQEKLEKNPDADVLHLGCGMDSRYTRIGESARMWYDVDFPEVIAERSRYYPEAGNYRMIAADLREEAWLKEISHSECAVIVMEGVSMYLTEEARNAVLNRIKSHFRHCYVLMDCYTVMAAKASKYKNPIIEVGVTQVYGMDDPRQVDLTFVREHNMTPDDLIDQLTPVEKRIFKSVFAGSFAGKLYRLYEYTT